MLSCPDEGYLNRRENNLGIGFANDLHFIRTRVASGGISSVEAVGFLEREEGRPFTPRVLEELSVCMGKIANGECLRYIKN